jgi:flavin reductase (DIM6/NTAB) family NADH-FMN oxidoreductase RutF
MALRPAETVDIDTIETSVPAPEFRRALAQFATGITVITALDGQGAPYGVTATSFASLSLDPPLIQWSLKTAAWSFPIFSHARHFAVNILAEDQETVSRTFSSPDVDRFAVTPHEIGLHGLPLISGCAAWLECETESQLRGGDHTIFVGRVRRTCVADRPPLLHWRGAYGFFDNAAREGA